MAKFDIKGVDEPVAFATADGEAIKLRLRRLSRTEKIDALTKMAYGELAESERLLLRYSVTGWLEVFDKDGQAIEFTFDNLDRVLGCDDQLGAEVKNHLLALNGMTEEGGEGDPLANMSAPGSPSSSNAECSAE